MRPAPRSREASEHPEDSQSLMNIKQPPVQWYAGELVLHIHIPVPPPPERLLKERAEHRRFRVAARSQGLHLRSGCKPRAGADLGS